MRPRLNRLWYRFSETKSKPHNSRISRVSELNSPARIRLGVVDSEPLAADHPSVRVRLVLAVERPAGPQPLGDGAARLEAEAAQPAVEVDLVAAEAASAAAAADEPAVPQAAADVEAADNRPNPLNPS